MHAKHALKNVPVINMNTARNVRRLAKNVQKHAEIYKDLGKYLLLELNWDES
jgi:hypothetical protein